jgi:type IV pilus assembly protein PilQ
VGQVAFSVFNSSMTRFLSLELSALEAEGDGKIISNPGW